MSPSPAPPLIDEPVSVSATAPKSSVSLPAPISTVKSPKFSSAVNVPISNWSAPAPPLIVTAVSLAIVLAANTAVTSAVEVEASKLVDATN